MASETSWDWQLDDACREGDLQRLQSLLNPPAKPTDEDLEYALTAAAEEGHSHIVSFLLDHKGVEITDTMVARATHGNSTAVYQAFLDHGWDINTKGVSGCTTLGHVDFPPISSTTRRTNTYA